VAEPDPPLLSALNTEHFVLQSAINATVSEAGARSTLYMMALACARSDRALNPASGLPHQK
jgi:hypothetical protein